MPRGQPAAYTRRPNGVKRDKDHPKGGGKAGFEAKGPDGLSERERLFVEFYVGECQSNGTAAAERAGYSARTARFQASRLMAKEHISRAVWNRRDKLGRQMGISAESLLHVLSVQLESAFRDGRWADAAKVSDMIGRHTGVQAFKANVRHEHSGPDGGPIEMDISGLSIDEKRNLLSILERLGIAAPDDGEANAPASEGDSEA